MENKCRYVSMESMRNDGKHSESVYGDGGRADKVVSVCKSRGKVRKEGSLRLGRWHPRL